MSRSPASHPNTIAGRVRAYLEAHAGEVVTYAELAIELYGARADGGPLWAPTIVRMAVHDLRALGAPIERVSGVRWQV